MAILGDAITKFAEAAGIPADNEHLKTFLSSATVSGSQIPDELVNLLSSGLMSVEAAKNNPTIKSHFVAQSYNAVDKQIEDALGELGIDPETAASLKAIGSTPAKVKAAITKIAELKSKAADATGSDKKELVEKINNLTKQVNDFQTTKAAEIEAAVAGVTQGYEGKFDELAQNNFFGKLKLANPLNWDADLLIGGAKSTVSAAMAQKGYISKRNGVDFELLTKEGTKVFENNKEVTYNDFATKVLLEKKQLEVAGNGQNQNNGGQQNNGQQKYVATPAAPSKGNNSFAAAAEEAATQFQN